MASAEGYGGWVRRPRVPRLPSRRQFGVAALAVVGGNILRAQPAPLGGSGKRVASKTGARGPLIVELGVSAFPFEGAIPETGEPSTPFLERDPDGRAFHLSPRGGKLYADKTYADARSLLFIPRHFETTKQAAIVLFLHGNLATLSRDVEGRQHVPAQVEASGCNAVLVAPQLAIDALDSSAGRFYEPGFLEIYLHAAAERLAAMSGGGFEASLIDRLPVVIVAYSGGYLPTAFALKDELARGHSRIAGILLLDALFGEEPKFAKWIIATHASTFFISAFSRSSAESNARLRQQVEASDIPIRRSIPTTIGPGDVVFQDAPAAVHNDFVTQAYARDPLRDMLSKIRLGRSDPAANEGASQLAPSGREPAGQADPQ